MTSRSILTKSRIRWLPITIVILTLVMAALVARDRYYLTKWAFEQRLSNARNIIASTSEHVEEYFDAVYITLNYVSLSPEVKSMSENSRSIVKNIFDFHWKKHRLSELYLIKRGFDGTHSPFMEFEPPLNGQNKEDVHSLEAESEEYSVQIEHLSRFENNPSLESLVSGRLYLCIDVRGLVMSVPIRNNGELVGIVSAMMPESRVITELNRGLSQGTIILYNGDNECYSSRAIAKKSDEDYELVKQHNATHYSPSSYQYEGSDDEVLLTRIHAYGDEDWWLVYDFSSASEGIESDLSSIANIWVPVASVLILGLLVAGLIETVRRRHEDNMSSLYRIQKTERSLRESEEWLSKTLSSIGDAVIATDKSSKISFMNRVAEKITGWSRDEAVGKTLPSIFQLNKNSGCPKEERSADSGAKNDRSSADAGDILVSKSGVKIPVDTSTAPIMSKTGETLGLVVVFRDVTDRIEIESRLRRGQVLLQSTIESTADGILVVAQSGRVLHKNTRFENMWRIPYELHQSDHDEKLIRFVLDQLTDPDAFLAKVKQLYDSNDTDLDIIHFKDGRQFERYSCPLIQDDVVTGRVWSFRDITEQKQSEKKLEELAQIPRSNPNGIMTLKTDGTILYLNPSFESLLAELQLRQDQIGIILPEDYLSLVRTCTIEERPLCNYETSYKDRNWLWVFSPIPNQETVHVFAMEITDRVQSEAHNLKLSAAVSQTANAVLITDKQGIIEYMNPSFEKTSGYLLSECKGKTPRILKSDRHKPKFYTQLWKTILAGKTWAGNIQNRSKSGRLYWERKIISPILGNNNEIMGFLSIGEDITRELQIQQAMVESDKLSAIGMLAAGVAHEFKNYLAGIIGNASFALENLGEEDGLEQARDTLERVISLGEKANDVAMSLLSYSKADSGDYVSEDICKIIQKSIELVEKEMLGSSIEIITYFEEVPDLRLSASKIQQLLINLLINARHAIKENGVITLAVKAMSETVEVRVGDTGSGISEDALSRVFDPFYSTKGVWGKDEVVGTGMGLAICRNIAQEHHGDLTVESRYGVGTTFTLALPYPDDYDDNAPVCNTPHNLKAILFTLETPLISTYFKQACQHDVKILPIDNIDDIGSNIREMADFAICDTKFTGKMELHRFTEMCKQNSLPYFMIRCGIMEHQLADLHESAVANFKEIPDINSILRLLPQLEGSQTPA